jgi:hypothetical protein
LAARHLNIKFRVAPAAAAAQWPGRARPAHEHQKFEIAKSMKSSTLGDRKEPMTKSENIIRQNCAAFASSLERLMQQGDTALYALKLPYILSNLFGVPIPELSEDFCVKSEDLPLPPRPLILASHHEGHTELLNFLLACKIEVKGSIEDFSLVESVRKLTHGNGDYEYKFPRQYLPSSLQEKVVNSTYHDGISHKMIGCTALELLVFSIAALPLIHFEIMSDYKQCAGYMEIVRNCTDAVFCSGQQTEDERVSHGSFKTGDAKFSHNEKDRVMQILTAFWLNPSVCFKRLYYRSSGVPVDIVETLESWITQQESQSMELMKSRLRMNRRVSQTIEAFFSRLKRQEASSMFQTWTELAYLRVYSFLRWALAEFCIEWKAQHTEREKEDLEDFKVYVDIWRHITCPHFWEDEAVDDRYKETYVLNNFPFFTIIQIDILRAIRIIFHDLASSSCRSQLMEPVLDTLCTFLDCTLGPAAESRLATFLRRFPIGSIPFLDSFLNWSAPFFEILVTFGPEMGGLRTLARSIRILFVVGIPRNFRRKWELALQVRCRVAEGGAGAGAAHVDLLRRWLAGSFGSLHPAEVLSRLQDGVPGGASGAVSNVERRILDQELNELLMLDDYVLAHQSAVTGGGAGWGGEAELRWIPALRRVQAQSRFLMGAGRPEVPPPRIQWEQLYQVSADDAQRRRGKRDPARDIVGLCVVSRSLTSENPASHNIIR